MWTTLLLALVQLFSLGISILISVAVFTLMERKALGFIHNRLGPNKVTFLGLSQPIADAIKLITKDDFSNSWSNLYLFYWSPMVMFTISLSIWLVFPTYEGTSMKFSMIVLMVFLGMSVYGILISGWSSNSKYALVGSMRSVSQSLSYEVVISFLFLMVMLVMSSFSLVSFWFSELTSIFMMWPPSLMLFLTAVLAELNRTPFDLSEGESELVSGYSIEYGGVLYTLLFLSENMSIFFSSFMISYFFFIKSVVLLPIIWLSVSLLICMIRAILPRMRYDILLLLCWVGMLPMTLLSLNMILPLL